MRAGTDHEEPAPAPVPPTAAAKSDKFSGDTVKVDENHLKAETASSQRSNMKFQHASAAEQTFEDVLANSPYLQILPIAIECSRGAIVMGNDTTPSILVAHFKEAHGTFDASKV